VAVNATLAPTAGVLLDAVTAVVVDVVEVVVVAAVEAPPQPARIGAIAKTSHAHLAK
jgi:hypothetical protein